MNRVHIRKTRESDLAAVERLLESSSLPTAGVGQHFGNYLVADLDGDVIGAIGLEMYDSTGLLRSAVVAKAMHNTGIGTKLFDALIQEAKRLNLDRLILLTTTAEKYFARKGFQSIDKNSVTGKITQSVEFTGACPSQAVCMELILRVNNETHYHQAPEQN